MSVCLDYCGRPRLIARGLNLIEVCVQVWIAQQAAHEMWHLAKAFKKTAKEVTPAPATLEA